MYGNVCKSKIIIISPERKKNNPWHSVIGASSVHEVLESSQLMGAPVVTSL